MANAIPEDPLVLPTNEEDVEAKHRNGTYKEMETYGWFSAHKTAIRNGSNYNAELQREMEALENKMDRIVVADPDTDLEVSFVDVYRPNRSHFPPIPCLHLHLTPDSLLHRGMLAKLRSFSKHNATSLEKIKGLCVYGHRVGNINGNLDDLGPYISVVSEFVECMASSAHIQFQLVMIQLDDTDDDETDEDRWEGPTGFRGNAEEFRHFAGVLDQTCKNMTFFRFHANIKIEGDDEVVDLNEILLAVKNRWSQTESDFFSIHSCNFFQFTSPETIQDFVRQTTFRCKIGLCSRNDHSGLKNIIKGALMPTAPNVPNLPDTIVSSNEHLKSSHLNLTHSFPTSRSCERIIRRLLRQNQLFATITLCQLNRDESVSVSILQDFWEASFLGCTTNVRINVRPDFDDDDDDGIENTCILASEILPNNTALEEFEPFSWHVDGDLGMEQMDKIMNAVQPFLDSNKAKRQRVGE